MTYPKIPGSWNGRSHYTGFAASPLVRPGSCVLYMKHYSTTLMLIGLGNTTIVNAAIDAANAFRIRHIGNWSSQCWTHNAFCAVFEILL